MSSPNSPKAAHSTLEASISSLSLHSKESGANEDWDQSMRVERPSTPNGVQSAEPTTVADPQSTTNGINGVNGGNFGTRGRKFGEMLRRHAEQGRSLNLSDEDEENLSEELGKWVRALASNALMLKMRAVIR